MSSSVVPPCVSPRVWVVDDSPLDAERARRVLSPRYEVEVFQDGSDALERLSSESAPEVMVLDWVMPGVTGVEVCRFLRSQASSAQSLGILLLTSHRDTQQIVEGLSAGANDYLAKPYADEELSARVGSLMRSQQLLQRAERAEAANRRLLETAPDPLLVLDAEGRLSFANEQASIALGQSTEALLGTRLDELIGGIDVAGSLINERSSRLPLPDLTVNGRRYSALLRTLPEGMSKGAIVSLRDVTERRRLDERRLDFYSIIAHDLRNPLNAIQLRTELMRSRKEADPALISSDIDKIQETIIRVGSMVNDFLELASLEDASFRIESAEVDLVTLLERTIDEHRPLLESRSQIWSSPTTEGSDAVAARVIGDAGRLSQVFSNLISNAIKFTPPNGTIAASLATAPGYIEVSIKDSGCGIEPALLPTLFQRYRRAEQHVGGTGLGLLIVREIVEAHGGTVGAESELGHGSRFWVRLSRPGLPRSSRVVDA